MARYSLSDFLEVRSAKGGRFTFDDSRVVYLSNQAGTDQLYCISVGGGEAAQLTDFQDPVSSFAISPAEDVLVFSKAQGGDENKQLFLLDLKTREITALTDKPEVRYDLGGWSRDGKLISFASNERNGTDFDVYILNKETRETLRIFDNGGRCEAGGFSPSGRYASVKVNHSNVNSDLYLCDLADNSNRCITAHEGDAVYGYPLWLPDESGLLLSSDNGREFIGLGKFSLDTMRFEYVLTPVWDIDGVSMDKGGRHLAVVLNEEGYNTVSFYEPTALKPRTYAVEKNQIAGIRFSNGGDLAVCTMGNSRTTSDLWIIDMADGSLRRLTRSLQKVSPESLVEPELARFDSFDGLSVPAFVYKPAQINDGERLPVVINIHGGPEAQSQPGFGPLTQYFVQAGYVVVVPNVRGSSGYGKNYLSLDNVEKRLDSVKDIVALRDYLATLPYVDTRKIALMGGSYGGFMVLACLAFYPELWAAGIDIVGIANFVTFLENTAPYRRGIREAEYGSLEKDRAFLESISPINSIDKIKAPLFVIHGANDPRVPLSEAEQVVSRLKELGREVELLVYSDEGHGLAKLKNRLDACPKIVGFLDTVLRGASEAA